MHSLDLISMLDEATMDAVAFALASNAGTRRLSLLVAANCQSEKQGWSADCFDLASLLSLTLSSSVCITLLSSIRFSGFGAIFLEIGSVEGDPLACATCLAAIDDPRIAAIGCESASGIGDGFAILLTGNLM